MSWSRFIATISQDLFNPCPWMFRPRIRLMGHPRPQFRAKADLPVGIPYRFNSSYELLLKVEKKNLKDLREVLSYAWHHILYGYNKCGIERMDLSENWQQKSKTITPFLSKKCGQNTNSRFQCCSFACCC